MMRLPDPPLLVISDRSQARQPLEAVAGAAFRGGCRWFSLREKDLPASERRELLTRLVALGRDHAALVMVHDDLDAAIAAGAGGVHLPGGSDPGLARARFAGLIGVSAHDAAEAAALLNSGADYVTLSPIFLTASKPGYGPALGLETLARAAAQAPGPIVALGGIDGTNAGACRQAGAAGIAVMGEVMRAADPEAAVRDLLSALSPKGDLLTGPAAPAPQSSAPEP